MTNAELTVIAVAGSASGGEWRKGTAQMPRGALAL